jgi:hypothetical protein
MIKITQQGLEFPRGQFKDWNDKPCGISLSSLADDRCIWLGPIGPSSMMLLNIEQVAELLPVLERFVKTGDIVESNG